MKQLLLEPIKLKSIKDTDLHYLKIKGKGNDEPIIINVGQKTFDNVKKLYDEAEPLQTKIQPNGGKVDSKNNKG